jgi:hypothetical protein
MAGMSGSGEERTVSDLRFQVEDCSLCFVLCAVDEHYYQNPKDKLQSTKYKVQSSI